MSQVFVWGVLLICSPVYICVKQTTVWINKSDIAMMTGYDYTLHRHGHLYTGCIVFLKTGKTMALDQSCEKAIK